jgi:hypothetical protein
MGDTGTIEIVINLPGGGKQVNRIPKPEPWPVIDRESHLKFEWTDGLESIYWTDTDERRLPNLRIPEHTDGYGGPLQRVELPRCKHGVYLTSWPIPELDYEDNVTEWKAPYCYCCWPVWSIYWTLGELQKRYRFIPKRKLEPREYRRLKGRLFDARPVYPEIFTEPIRLKGHKKLTYDLRLQEDYETGKPRFETMGGYVAKESGHGRAGRGHGPDNDADDIRMVWLSAHEESPVGHGEHETQDYRAGWTTTLPSVCPPCLKLKAQQTTYRYPRRHPQPEHPDWYSFWGWREIIEEENGITGINGIREQNWFPHTFPIVSYRAGGMYDREINATNTIGGFGLKEAEFFSDDRTVVDQNDRGWRRAGGAWTGRPSVASAFDYKWDSRWVGGRRASKPLRYPVTYRGRTTKEEQDARDDVENFPKGDWFSSIEWVMCSGQWRCRLAAPAILPGCLPASTAIEHKDVPTKKHIAQWGRKAEYKRGGSKLPVKWKKRHEQCKAATGPNKPKCSCYGDTHRNEWPENWREEQRVWVVKPVKGKGRKKGKPGKQETIAAKIDMYRHGTREIQEERMSVTARENYRQAKLKLARNHGTFGFWRAATLEGNERGTSAGTYGGAAGGVGQDIPQVKARLEVENPKIAKLVCPNCHSEFHYGQRDGKRTCADCSQVSRLEELVEG